MVLVATLGPIAPAESSWDGKIGSGPRSTYIVQLGAPPVASSPGPISALDVTSRLDRLQGSVLSAAKAGRAPVVHRYRSSFSGFAARLTAREAAGLAATAGVVGVTPDTVSHPLAAPALAAPAPTGVAGSRDTGLPGPAGRHLGAPRRAGEGR